VFSSFDTTGFRRAHLVSCQFVGEGSATVVDSCTIEVEYENRQEEVTVPFLGVKPTVETVTKFIEALNATLGC
jgi:hypothetical protein